MVEGHSTAVRAIGLVMADKAKGMLGDREKNFMLPNCDSKSHMIKPYWLARGIKLGARLGSMNA